MQRSVPQSLPTPPSAQRTASATPSHVPSKTSLCFRDHPMLCMHPTILFMCFPTPLSRWCTCPPLSHDCPLPPRHCPNTIDNTPRHSHSYTRLHATCPCPFLSLSLILSMLLLPSSPALSYPIPLCLHAMVSFSFSLSLFLSLSLNPSLPPSLSLILCFLFPCPFSFATFSLCLHPLHHSLSLFSLCPPCMPFPPDKPIHPSAPSTQDPSTKHSLQSLPSLPSQATHQSLAGCQQPVRRSSAAESASKQSTSERTARTAAAPPPHLPRNSPTTINPPRPTTSHTMHNTPLHTFRLPATHTPPSTIHSFTAAPHQKTGPNMPMKATPMHMIICLLSCQILSPPPRLYKHCTAAAHHSHCRGEVGLCAAAPPCPRNTKRSFPGHAFFCPQIKCKNHTLNRYEMSRVSTPMNSTFPSLVCRTQ